MSEIRKSIGREALHMLIDDIGWLEVQYYRVRQQIIEYGVLDEEDMPEFTPFPASKAVSRLYRRIQEREKDEEQYRKQREERGG